MTKKAPRHAASRHPVKKQPPASPVPRAPFRHRSCTRNRSTGWGRLGPPVTPAALLAPGRGARMSAATSSMFCTCQPSGGVEDLVRACSAPRSRSSRSRRAAADPCARCPHFATCTSAATRARRPGQAPPDRWDGYPTPPKLAPPRGGAPPSTRAAAISAASGLAILRQFACRAARDLAHHQPLQKRVARQPVGPVQPRACALTYGIEPRHIGPAAGVGHHTADGVVGRRMHRNRVLRGVKIETW